MTKDEKVQAEYALLLKGMIKSFSKFNGKIILEANGEEYFLSGITNTNAELILHADVD